MRFAYNANKDKLIENHERIMLEKYSKIIDNYSSMFKQYNCYLKIGFYWSNLLKKNRSNYRLPFQNGYSCYVYCEVQKEGKEVHVKSIDGEVDYYPLSTAWMVSSMERKFFRINVLLYTNTDEAESNMKDFFQLLSNAK